MPDKSNVLLASLPGPTLRDMLPELKVVKLELGEVLCQPGDPIREVYFPATCLISLIVVVAEMHALEVALIGHEGMVGVPLALGARLTPVRALVQGTGLALKMSKTAFVAAMRNHEPLRKALHAFSYTLMAQIGQTAACNRFHLLEARLARWLLMTRDRAESSELMITQEFLSTMLGVRRVTVSEAASSFRHKGLIEYSRGRITILDHAGLEAACCSCYGDHSASQGALPAWRPTPSEV